MGKKKRRHTVTFSAIRCAWCGRNFPAARSDALTCGMSCRQARARAIRSGTHTAYDDFEPPFDGADPLTPAARHAAVPRPRKRGS